eukprot:TRINITY_DN214_c0_g1_i1.p1 TRINITY_DN214_c0_g1~~TRINITY_DN214_c0_g1_i1.p1  ORF type:complete len:336 (-),score=59.56 TRINITY_DN214_c0_g1_i1:945-1952(-)
MNSILFVLALLSISASAVEVTTTLEPFSGVRLCVPYTVQIEVSDPAAEDQYLLEANADQAVIDAMVTEVNQDGELVLTSDGDFETGNSIEVVIKLPATELTSVIAQGFGHVLISGAFESEDLSVVSGGTKAVYAPNLKVTKTLTVDNSGVGDVVLGNALGGDIKVTETGIVEVFLLGVTGNVLWTGSGISTLGVEAASDSVVIGGSARGLSEAQYTGGQCTLARSFFSSPCKSVTSLDIPVQSTDLAWTCGIKVEGKSTCGASTGSSVGTQTLVSDGLSFSSASASAGGSGSTVSSRSSSGPGGVTTVTVQGDNAAAVAISNAECNVGDADLKIV